MGWESSYIVEITDEGSAFEEKEKKIYFILLEQAVENRSCDHHPRALRARVRCKRLTNILHYIATEACR